MSVQELITRVAALDLPLQGKLDVLKEEFETKMMSPDVVAIMHRSTEQLIASGQADRALKAGDQAPAFSLPDADGKLVSSASLLAKGPLVITFYRGVWCPYCNFDLEALEKARTEIELRGASLIAVSPQTQANSRKSGEANGLGYPVLVDRQNELAAQFGLRWSVPDGLKQVHKMLGADLEAFNGEDSWSLPMPARYVIDQDGKIAYAEINPDYTRRPEPADLFPVLDMQKRCRAA